MRKWDTTTAEILVENTTIPLREVAQRCGTTYGNIRGWFSETYNKEYRDQRKIVNYRNSKLGDKNPMKGKVGAAHHNFIGRASDHKGYFTVVKPDWWTGPNKGKRVFEHHVVYALANGLTEIPLGMHVHHIDHIRGNNSPGNLELLTPEEHKERHT